MPQTYQRWATSAEAHAFAAGVTHANDGALTVRTIYADAHPTEPWVVLMEDEDADAPQDPAADLAVDQPAAT